MIRNLCEYYLRGEDHKHRCHSRTLVQTYRRSDRRQRGSVPIEVRLALTIATLVAFSAIAETGTEYRVTRHTIDGGGVMRSTGGSFELSGTLGQPDAGVAAGGAFELTGGFWFAIPPGDVGEDGVVDLNDHRRLVECLGGPDAPVNDDCRILDIDRNGAIDMRDVAVVQRGFTGP